MKRQKILRIGISLILIGIIGIGLYIWHTQKEDNINEPTNQTHMESPKIDKKEASLTLVGDLLFESPFYNAVSNGYDKDNYFSLVKKYFQEDDLSIGNMEVVIGNDNLKVSGDGYNFCAPAYIGDLVHSVGFEVLGTANNHAFDRGIAGLNSTLDFFRNKTDILTVGTYKNASERDKLYVKEINDIKFGFLAYTYGTNQKIAENEKNLIAYYRNPYTKEWSAEYKEKLKEEIEKLRSEVDVVVVLMHWGIEFTFNPNSEQKEVAKYLNNLGVDIIVGSHSHSMQPVEVIEKDGHKTLVYYSLGNFVSADDDIARTPKGQETFDNAYQIGLLSTLKVIKNNDKIEFENILVKPIINYFDKNMDNFLLIPFDAYTEEYEHEHERYSYGLTKEFIKNTYESVISKEYRS